MVAPVLHLTARAFEADDPVGLLGSARVARLVWATLRLGVTVALLGLLVGVALAWLLERTDLPGRSVLGVVAVLPLVVPSYVSALALVAAFGPEGLLWEVPGLVGFWGATFALVLSTYPYVLLVARAGLAASDPALEDAARALGSNRQEVFLRVVLPQLRPALSAGTLLTLLYVLSDFGAVAIMRYDTLTRGIFLEYRSSFDRAPAAMLGVVLVAITLVLIVAERAVRGRPAPPQLVAGRGHVRLTQLGRWRAAAIAAVTLPGILGVGVPVGVLSWWASDSADLLGALGELSTPAATSLLLSGAAAIVAVLLALPVALVAVRHRSSLGRATEVLALSGHALPGLVVALALVFLAARYLPFAYQTLGLVVAAYVVRFLPEALASVRSSLATLDPAVEEVARTLGRGRLRVATTVTLPLIRGGLAAGAALVFLTAMKELPATLLLRPAGTDTLAVRVWTGASEGFYAQAAPAGLLLVAASALVLIPLWSRAGFASGAS